MTVDDENEFIVDDILSSRREPRTRRLQFKVKWQGYDRDDEWYYADAGEFDNAKDVVEEFYKRYPRMIR